MNKTSGQEIELKLRIEDVDGLKRKLKEVGARFICTRQQVDTLFESPVVHFREYDQALRLRRETSENKNTALLTFKGTPTITAEGHKIRDEFESPVEGIMMERILNALGFVAALHIKKTRESYELDEVAIEIDTLDFGAFLELEGSSQNIERIRQKLGLEQAEPMKKGYHVLQREWENRKNA